MLGAPGGLETQPAVCPRFETLTLRMRSKVIVSSICLFRFWAEVHISFFFPTHSRRFCSYSLFAGEERAEAESGGLLSLLWESTAGSRRAAEHTSATHAGVSAPQETAERTKEVNEWVSEVRAKVIVQHGGTCLWQSPHLALRADPENSV